MPTTRKQKKARKSRGFEVLSDIENLDIMLGENHFKRLKGRRALIALLLEDMRVLQATILRMKAKTHIPVTGMLTPGQMPIMAKIQPI